MPLLPPTSLSPVQLIEDLRKELEHLQMYKLDCERPGRGRSSSSGLGEFSARAREVELEHEIKRLKQVGPESLCPHRVGLCEGQYASMTSSHILAVLSTPAVRAAHPHLTALAGGLPLGYVRNPRVFPWRP